MSMMAGQRMGQIPATREELLDRHRGRRIRLPALRAREDEEGAPAPATSSREAARARASWLVERLQGNPDDVPAREELARVWAEDLGLLEGAMEQVELLLAMRDAHAGKVAEWLSLIAGWHLRFRRDEAAGREWLERLIREHPDTPQALAAGRRLKVMDLEQKLRQARQRLAP
jgi:hypothetical protein